MKFLLMSRYISAYNIKYQYGCSYSFYKFYHKYHEEFINNMSFKTIFGINRNINILSKWKIYDYSVDDLKYCFDLAEKYDKKTLSYLYHYDDYIFDVGYMHEYMDDIIFIKLNKPAFYWYYDKLKQQNYNETDDYWSDFNMFVHQALESGINDYIDFIKPTLQN